MPETQHHSIDFVLIATATTPAAAIQGIKPCHKPASKAPGLIKSLATSAAKAAGGIKPKASVTRDDSVLPRKANAGAMRKNAMAAHDDSHRTKNSLTGIASTPSFGENIARKRSDNADKHACRHGDIRPPQELAYGDGHRSQTGSYDIAARQSLRKE